MLLPKDIKEAMRNPNLTRDQLGRYGVWVNRDGKREHVSEMITPHLENVLRFTRPGTRIHQFVLDELVDRMGKLEGVYFQGLDD